MGVLMGILVEFFRGNPAPMFLAITGIVLFFTFAGHYLGLTLLTIGLMILIGGSVLVILILLEGGT